MPIYEYKCRRCGETFDEYRPYTSGDEGVKCPKCGAEHPKRLISFFVPHSNSGGCAPTRST